MKNYLLLVLILILCINLKAQKENIAIIYPLNDSISTFYKDIIQAKITQAIINSDKYEALTRGDIDKIVSEYKFQASGLVKDSDIINIGNLAAAKHVCVTNLALEKKQISITVNIINVETGVISFTVSKITEYNNEIENDAISLANELLRVMNPSKPPIAFTKSYGKISIKSNVSADLYLDSIKKVYIKANTTNNILENIPVGNHIVKIGNKTQIINVHKDTIVNISFDLPTQLEDSRDGEIYKITYIGNQIWFAENLRATKYTDGTNIVNSTDSTEWVDTKSPAYCWYNNDITNKNNYSALYNWYAIDKKSNGDKNICPTGYHVSSDADWKKLEIYCGMSKDIAEKSSVRGTTEGQKLKSKSLWIDGNGTDEHDFTALPSGYRYAGEFKYLGKQGYWWTSTIKEENDIWNRIIYNTKPQIMRHWNNKNCGFSLRCVMD